MSQVTSVPPCRTKGAVVHTTPVKESCSENSHTGKDRHPTVNRAERRALWIIAADNRSFWTQMRNRSIEAVGSLVATRKKLRHEARWTNNRIGMKQKPDYARHLGSVLYKVSYSNLVYALLPLPQSMLLSSSAELPRCS